MTAAPFNHNDDIDFHCSSAQRGFNYRDGFLFVWNTSRGLPAPTLRSRDLKVTVEACLRLPRLTRKQKPSTECRFERYGATHEHFMQHMGPVDASWSLAMPWSLAVPLEPDEALWAQPWTRRVAVTLAAWHWNWKSSITSRARLPVPVVSWAWPWCRRVFLAASSLLKNTKSFEYKCSETDW